MNARATSSDVFDAIAHPVRRRIVQRLGRGPAAVHELQGSFDITQQAVSKHLRVLSEAGVAVSRRRGQENVYYLVPESLKKVRTWLDSFWNERLASLKSIAEEEE